MSRRSRSPAYSSNKVFAERRERKNETLAHVNVVFLSFCATLSSFFFEVAAFTSHPREGPLFLCDSNEVASQKVAKW